MEKLQFNIGNKVIGGNSKVLIQSMGDRITSDYEYNANLTNKLEKIGLDMMRFSVLDKNDALAIKKIKDLTHIPIIADIHFDYNLALASIDSGADKIRINPGNIGSEDRIRTIINKCKEKNIPIRIGVNSGSLNKYKGKTSSKVEDMLLAMDETLNIFECENFDHLVLSLKSSDPTFTEEIYQRAYERYKYPLHIGLTESGFSTLGIMKSTRSLYPLLKKGIGDTIRISLADDRIEEIRACKDILKLAGRRKDVPDMIVCPTCGRTKIDLKPISREVLNYLDYVNKDIKIAVMGCPVNGIGEASDADYGIAGSGKENIYVLFSHGKEIGLYEKEEALKKLFSLIDEF